jgi:hypothetical protein
MAMAGAGHRSRLADGDSRSAGGGGAEAAGRGRPPAQEAASLDMSLQSPHQTRLEWDAVPSQSFIARRVLSVRSSGRWFFGAKVGSCLAVAVGRGEVRFPFFGCRGQTKNGLVQATREPLEAQ